MTLEKYMQETQRTLPDLGSEILNSCHMTMGINSEVPEILEVLQSHAIKINMAKLIDESGDLFWYLSNYCSIRNLIFAPNINPTLDYLTSQDAIQDGSYKLLDIDKKCLAYNKPFNSGIAQKYVGEIYAGLIYILSWYKIEVFEVFEKNINKLRVRFPEKFDADLAINKSNENEWKVFLKS